MYYKDGRFTKITAPDSVDFLQAHWATDTLAIWGHKTIIDGQEYENQLFRVTNRTRLDFVKSWNFVISEAQPQFIFEIIKDKGQWQVISQRGGLYNFSFTSNTFSREYGAWFYSASITALNDFIGVSLDGSVSNTVNGERHIIFLFDPENPFTYPTKTSYKNDLVVLQHYQHIYIGIRK